MTVTMVTMPPESRSSDRAGSSSLLNTITPVLAILALLSTIAALSTNTWLHTEEKMKNYNRTIKFGPGSQPEFYSKKTTSGLWTICVSKVGGKNFTCMSISYFPQEKYQPDDQDSTHAIPYSARNSAIYFILSFIFLLIGEFFCFATFLKSGKKIFAFFSGISFVVGGLITLVGIINYISIFKAEVGNKLYSRSILAEPVFTYSYGYSFGLLIFSFLTSELSGICSIFQFIYYHQYKWDQIEKNNVSEHSGLNGLTKDQSSCKIIATMSNGTIKTLCDTKENISKSESVSESSDKKLSDLGTTTLFPRIVPNTFHSHQDIKQNQNFDDCNCLVFNDQKQNMPSYLKNGSASNGGLLDTSQYYNQLIYAPRQATISSITTDTTGFSSSLCSPSYLGTNQALSWTESSANPTAKQGPAWMEVTSNSTNNWVASIKVPGPHLTVDRASSSQGSDSSEERRKRVTRHISIDDTPITHTYHQNSLESSSESSHSPSEESSGDTSNPPWCGQYRGTLDRSSGGPGAGNIVMSEIKAGPAVCIQSSTLPSSLRNKRTLKSSLSKTSSLKRNTTNKFETQENLQQIVKQKRENCLQNGLSLSRESIGDVFEENETVSQV